MHNIFAAIAAWLHSLFNRNIPAPAPRTPLPKPLPEGVLPPLPSTPQPAPSAQPSEDFSALVMGYTKQALELVMKFEGNLGYGNVSGNFDGTGLSAGALNWPFKFGIHQEMVQRFVSEQGRAAVFKLMPKWGGSYLSLCGLLPSEGVKAIAKWSDSKGRVLPQYASELSALWSSPAMREIQLAQAYKQCGVWAMKQIELSFLGMRGSGTFSERHAFCFWFDQAVMNGTGKTPLPNEINAVSLAEVFNWMKAETGASMADFKKNIELWQKQALLAGSVCGYLLRAAYLRADRASATYDTTTMNRRGTLALGRGWVNGQLWDLVDDLKIPAGAWTSGIFTEPRPSQQLPIGTAPTYMLERERFFDLAISIFRNKWKGEKESHGKNRSPKLDAMILRQGGKLGDPYCLFGLQEIDDEVAKAMGKKSKLPESGGTQYFWGVILEKFPKRIYKTPFPGALGIYRQRSDHKHGHAVMATSQADANGMFGTAEFNTDASGSRDGSTCCERTRTLAGDKNLELMGFVDWAAFFE